MPINKYYDLAKTKLYPICRSITGKGLEDTLKIIKQEFRSMKIYSIKSGTKVFDWKIPPEWNIKDAYVLDKYNNKIINFKNNNLHIVGYSIPIKRSVKKRELINHIHVNEKLPNAIPYITSYYKKYWGFCCTKKVKKEIEKKYNFNDKFKILIDSSLDKNGFLKFGELIIPGKSKKEILISTYVCHPSMANNELSGPIVSMSLINHFKKKKNLKTLRFIFIPETIGSISYLNKNLKKLKKNIIGGFNLSCIGDEKLHSCILSKYSNSPSDYALLKAYKLKKIKFKKFSFLERGSDERQFNSPGIDIPMTSIFRSKYGKYKEYHSSLDDFNLVTRKGLLGGFNIAKTAIEILQKDIIPKSIFLCEPNLGKRNLYPTLSQNNLSKISQNYLDFLTYSDGKNNLETISKYIKVKYRETLKIYKILKKKKLIV